MIDQGLRETPMKFRPLHDRVVVERIDAALQGAASVAGLLITTEAMVAEVPRKQAAAPTMPGGGMDF